MEVGEGIAEGMAEGDAGIVEEEVLGQLIDNTVSLFWMQ